MALGGGLNHNHTPAGVKEGGQFAKSGCGISVRDIGEAYDLSTHVKKISQNSQKAEEYRVAYGEAKMKGDKDAMSEIKAKRHEFAEERGREIRDALYDLGYLRERTEKVKNNGEAERLLCAINEKHIAKEEWSGNEKFVQNYVDVCKGFLASGKFDLVTNGFRSSDGSVRTADEITGEFGLGKEDVRDIISKSLTADDFVQSGKNDSSYKPNQGTVVMVFAPTVKLQKQVHTENGIIEKTESVNLYVKMVLNPHPDKSRGQTYMQIISFKEANHKVCLFTGKEKNLRR